MTTPNIEARTRSFLHLHGESPLALQLHSPGCTGPFDPPGPASGSSGRIQLRCPKLLSLQSSGSGGRALKELGPRCNIHFVLASTTQKLALVPFCTSMVKVLWRFSCTARDVQVHLSPLEKHQGHQAEYSFAAQSFFPTCPKTTPPILAICRK